MNDYDQRLVDLYDQDNPDGPDHDLYRALAEEVSARSVLDLGCGTGILTVTLARDGRDVVGIDPSPAMLTYVRGRPGRGRKRIPGPAGSPVMVALLVGGCGGAVESRRGAVTGRA